MGRSPIAPEVFNCSAPDTGNMEVLERYGTRRAEARSGSSRCSTGDIRSAFAMTEPDVASSDATNIETRIERDGDDYVINGRKWWTSGAGDPRCKILIVMGKTDPEAPRHTPAVDDPGADATRRASRIVRPLTVFGYDDAPHGHWRSTSRMSACPGRTSCSAKAAASRSPRAGSGRAASTTACA